MNRTKATAILLTGGVAGTTIGAVVGFVVQWEVTEWLIRHSSYRNHSNGHVWNFVSVDRQKGLTK